MYVVVVVNVVVVVYVVVVVNVVAFVVNVVAVAYVVVLSFNCGYCRGFIRILVLILVCVEVF